MHPKHRPIQRHFAARLTAIIACAAALLWPPAAGAYSVLSHEEVVDMAWKDRIIPLLRARFPDMTVDDIRQAHGYAYGGSVIQDIGYYPFGNHYFSDLLHYVRPNEFVDALIRDSTTPDEYAFALGALAHFCGDSIGHPAINKITSDENPPLRSRFGEIVTYAQNPLAHLRTEFGFDVVEVAQGHYSQENYRDFIGFQVSKSLLERAFQETYGIPMSDVMKHEDLAIGSYRRAVSSIIPEMTKVAFVNYKSQIKQASPGIEKRKFLYRLNQTEYEKDFGTDYYHVGFRGRIGAFLLHIVPKVGPFKALKVTLPDGQQQDTYIKSINATVDKFRHYLTEIHAAPAPIPPPDPKDATEARKSADKVAKDVTQAKRLADQEQDPAEKASLEKVADNVAKTSEKANRAADRMETKVAADEAAKLGLIPEKRTRVAATVEVQPPSTPVLPELDLDTGEPTGVGEYRLADATYAKLLGELVKDARSANGSAPPALIADVTHFFEHPAPPAARPLTEREAKMRATLLREARENLATLNGLQPMAAK
jgi:hypothetical protein